MAEKIINYVGTGMNNTCIHVICINGRIHLCCCARKQFLKEKKQSISSENNGTIFERKIHPINSKQIIITQIVTEVREKYAFLACYN